MVARKHHYVPKCYLKAFSEENLKKKKRELCVFDRVEKKKFGSAPDDVGLQKDFNTIDLEGHAPDAFEKALSSVEDEIGPALTRIIKAKSIADENDKTLLLNLACLLYVHNPRFREIKRSFHERVMKMIMDVVLSKPEIWNSQAQKAKDAGYIDKGADTDYEKIKKEYSAENYKLQVSNEEHLRSEMDVFDHALPLFFERKWILAKAPADSLGFITCDHPVSLVRSEPQKTNRRLGLKTRETEIIFPISPDLIVIGSYENENGECELDKDLVAACNGIAITNSERQVYAIRENFFYQIDRSNPPKQSAGLIEDELFLR